MNRESTRKFPEVQWGSGNVFADLGFKDADLHLAKAALVLRVTAVIGESKLTRRQAAKTLETDQRTLSQLLSGDFSRISIDRALRFLLALNQNVDIVVTAKKKNRTSRIRVFAK